MATSEPLLNNYFKVLRVLHLAMSLGALLFGLVTFFLLFMKTVNFIQTDLSRILKYLVIIVSFIGIGTSDFIFKQKIKQIQVDEKLVSKMEKYRNALLVRYAILEGSAIFGIISTFISNNISFLIFSGIVIIVLIIVRPNLKSASSDLQLGQQDIATLEENEATIG